MDIGIVDNNQALSPLTWMMFLRPGCFDLPKTAMMIMIFCTFPVAASCLYPLIILLGRLIAPCCNFEEEEAENCISLCLSVEIWFQGGGGGWRPGLKLRFVGSMHAEALGWARGEGNVLELETATLYGLGLSRNLVHRLILQSDG